LYVTIVVYLNQAAERRAFWIVTDGEKDACTLDRLDFSGFHISQDRCADDVASHDLFNDPGNASLDIWNFFGFLQLTMVCAEKVPAVNDGNSRCQCAQIQCILNSCIASANNEHFFSRKKGPSQVVQPETPWP
jgi:hypothetical protein